MRLLILADTYPPNKTSGAVLLSDLAVELSSRGESVVVVIPMGANGATELTQDSENLSVLRVASPELKDVSYARRALAELALSRRLKKGILAAGLGMDEWDGVIWYSPTIFLGELAKRVMQDSNCSGYLILRDIFPEWAVDMGIMSRGVAYRFFKYFEKKQYAAASSIGVQSLSSIEYFRNSYPAYLPKVEVLNNWLGPATYNRLPEEFSYLDQHEGIIVCYTGNMGIAQGMSVFLEVAELLAADRSILFVFVGRGSEKSKLECLAREKNLNSVHFHNEIEPEQVNSLLSKSHIGLVSLDVRHSTNNVPGKLLAYIREGLSVMAKVNEGNELVELFSHSAAGIAVTEDNAVLIKEGILQLKSSIDMSGNAKEKGLEIFEEQFQVSTAASQIMEAF